MKKSTLLKLALVFVAMLIIAGANAQPWTGKATVSKYNQSTLTNNPATVTYTNLVTINKTMPFWAWPSLAYNPSFVETGFDANYPTQAQIETNVNSNFAWRTGPDFAGLGAVAGFTKNYVEINFAALGNRLIEVVETPASGICPGLPVYFGLKVIAVPAANISNATSTTVGLNNVIVSKCDGDPLLTTAVNINLSNVDESAPYWVNMPYAVYSVAKLTAGGQIPNVAGVIDVASPDVTNITATSTVHVYGQDAATVPSTTNPIIINASPVVASQAYVAQTSNITVYEFTYNNLNATISRKSDYIAARTGAWTATSYGSFSYYPAIAANTKYYIVAFPTPVTGPIYHIANNFAY